MRSIEGYCPGLAPDSRRGSALHLVMMMNIFTMGIWAVTFRATRDAIDAESFHSQRIRFEQRIVKGLTWAGNMFDEEKPGKSRATFLFTGKDEKGRFYTTVEIRRRGSDRFEVTSKPASRDETRCLPKNPSHF